MNEKKNPLTLIPHKVVRCPIKGRKGWGGLRGDSCPYEFIYLGILCIRLGWSGGAMVLGKLPVPGRPTILITVGQGPIALAVSAVGVVWIFLLSSTFSPFSPSLWETARYRLKYCLKGR